MEGEDWKAGKEALDYWQQQSPTLDGIMGGFGELSERDVRESVKFVTKYLVKSRELENSKPFKRIADLGAGIGRVSELVLSIFSDKIDLFEPVGTLLREAEARLNGRKEEIKYNEMSLQDFARLYEVDGSNVLYDLIWIQWTAMYLSKEELIRFLAIISKALSQDGYIIIKDNYSRHEDTFDEEDYSYTRSLASWNSIIDQSGLKNIVSIDQEDWYQDLYKVRMFALQPK